MALENPQDPPDPTTAPAPRPRWEGTSGRALWGALLSWVGVLISWLLLQKGSGLLGHLCHAGSGCDVVLSSRYAMLRGVPLPWLGLGFYALVFTVLAVSIGAARSAWRENTLSSALWLSVAGLTFSALLMWVQFGVLRAFCPLCTASAVVMLGLVVTLARADPGEVTPGSRLVAFALAGMALVSGLALGLSMGGVQGAVVVIVNGQRFTREQMEEELAGVLQPLHQQRYALESDWVRRKVDGVLLSEEARRRSTTVEKLVAAKIGELPPPTPEQVEMRLAEMGRAVTAETAAAAREEMLREQARSALVGEIASRHQIQIFLPPPRLRAVAIDLTTAKTFGPEDAAVKVVIFSDFQCPFCVQLAPDLQRLRHEFGSEVLIAFRYFPIEAHARALPAAVAAECAAEQGLFWEYHDRLFTAGGDLSESRLVALAMETGLDEARFRQCLREERPRKLVEASQQDAAAAGLEGAPAVFVNGRRVEGALGYEALAKRIRAELNRVHPPGP